MSRRPLLFLALLWSLLPAAAVAAAAPPALPAGASIDARVAQAMDRTSAKGLALAVVDGGKIVHVKAYGVRNAKSDPLQLDTVMYGASLTKTVLAYTALQLVDRGELDLDKPIASYLAKPLPEYPSEPKYADWAPLASDPRWRKITPRIALTHSTGFSNFGFLEPDGKLKIHFEPGSRYAYSGDGIILVQFAIEQGLGRDVGELTQKIFAGLGMKRTSLIWRPDFAGNLADGWNDQGKVEAHDERSKVRAAGSMDTTIDDLAKFAAALVRGDGLSAASRRELAHPILPITTAHQFPSLAPELPVEKRRKDLHAGLGVIVFQGPQGPGFFKGGHNGTTANTLVCLEAGQRAVLILANDVRAEAAFAELVQFILGDTGVPYDWEYADRAGKS
jgi:CubicO group peptidase (beta-lactamase class C family)